MTRRSSSRMGTRTVPTVVAAALLSLLWFGRAAPSSSVRAPAPPARLVVPRSAPAQSVQAAPVVIERPLAVRPGPAPDAEFDEKELMLLLRSARGHDPALCVELAREGNLRFPDSADAAERASILIFALSELGRTSEARGEAEDMVNRYPDDHWVREVERFTGAHRHRNVRVDAQGQLHYVDPPPPS